jgi:hypothetical protein
MMPIPVRQRNCGTPRAKGWEGLTASGTEPAAPMAMSACGPAVLGRQVARHAVDTLQQLRAAANRVGTDLREQCGLLARKSAAGNLWR